MSADADLLGLLRRVRELLRAPRESFDADVPQAASAEIDRHLSRVEDSGRPNWNELHLLFAPIPTLQEISMSNGCAEEFRQLAEKFDLLKSSTLD